MQIGELQTKSFWQNAISPEIRPFLLSHLCLCHIMCVKYARSVGGVLAPVPLLYVLLCCKLGCSYQEI